LIVASPSEDQAAAAAKRHRPLKRLGLGNQTDQQSALMMRASTRNRRLTSGALVPAFWSKLNLRILIIPRHCAKNQISGGGAGRAVRLRLSRALRQFQLQTLRSHHAQR
jgi:hypothetical protein